jgi:TetR/AcrR family transcriptional regulator
MQDEDMEGGDKSACTPRTGSNGARHRSPSSETRRDRKRTALIRAAVSEFNRRGFHQTSLDDIGERFGISKGALYYYFPSKSALLANCFEWAMVIARDCLREAKKKEKTGRAKIITFFRLYIEKTNEELHDCFLLTEDYALDPDDRVKLVRGRDRIEHELRQIIRDGIADGSIVRCDPKLAVFMLLGAVNWMPKWFSPTGTWNYRQVAQATADILDRMLTTAPVESLVDDVAKIFIEARPEGAPA